MSDIPFSTEEALRFGWNTTKAHWRPLLLLGAIEAVIFLFEQALSEPPGSRPGLRGLLMLVLQVGQMGVTLVWLRTALRLYDGQPADLAHWPEVFPQFFSYLIAAVMFGLVVAGGLILLIVPGVIWGLQFAFFGFAVLDRNLDPLAALKESSRLTRGVKGSLFWFALALFGVNLLGAIAFGVGLLWTIPLSFLAGAYVYRRLRARAAEPVVPVTAPPGPGLPTPTGASA